MIYIGSAMTEDYYARAEPYFRTLKKVTRSGDNNVKYFFVGLDFNPSYLLKKHGVGKEVLAMELRLNQLHDPKNNIIQHGDFLTVKGPWKDDDYILWVDCDAYYQRPLSEYDTSNFNKHAICAGVLPNCGQETLRHEFVRLGGAGTPEITLSELGFSQEIIDYATLNTGAVGASVVNWEKMRKLYNKDAFKIKKYFNHYARQQFLMSLITYQHFSLSKMPKYTHCDGHYTLPDHIKLEREKWIYDDGKIRTPAYYCHGGILMNAIYSDITKSKKNIFSIIKSTFLD
jgi:hypothetical protein